MLQPRDRKAKVSLQANAAVAHLRVSAEWLRPHPVRIVRAARMASLEDVLVKMAEVSRRVSPLRTDGLYVSRIRSVRIRVSLGLVTSDSHASTVVEAEETGSLGTEVAMLIRHGIMTSSGPVSYTHLTLPTNREV